MRAALGDKNINFVALTLSTTHTLSHLAITTSVLGNLPRAVDAKEDSIGRLTATSSRCCPLLDPSQLPWNDLGVERRLRSAVLVHQPRPGRRQGT